MFGRKDAGSRGNVADERHVTRRTPLDGRARRHLERDLHRTRLRRVTTQVPLVLERGEVRVHGGRGREAHGLADLAHARRVTTAPDLAIDELEHLALALGQGRGGDLGCGRGSRRCGSPDGGAWLGGTRCGHCEHRNTITCSGQTPVRLFP